MKKEITTQMTLTQAIKEAEKLSEFFSCVRLLDENTVCGKTAPVYSYPKGEYKYCYELTGKISPCTKCVSAECIQSRTSKNKLELVNGKLFRVSSHYRLIDDKPYALELIEEVGEETVIESDLKHQKILNTEQFFDKMYKDSLTGCYNRRYFEERIKNRKLVAGIAILDIDDFKLYNDVYGHDAGDDILKLLAIEIRSCIRSTDKLIRYGGDEFLLVIPEVKQSLFFNILFDIKTKVNSLDISGFSGLKASVSIGGVCTHGETVSEAVSRADKLMYKAKHNKNVIITENSDDGEISAQSDKRYVLIVDDAPINREMLAMILKNEFNIIEAENGKQCIEKIKQYGNRISVVLLDLIMPEMDGFAVLEYMKVNALTEDIPVIVVTNDDSNISISKAYEIGIADYIRRPFDVKVVYRRVKNTVQLYSTHKRLLARATKQMSDRENDLRIMSAILGQIVEFRNCESYNHVVNIRRLTESILKLLVLKTDKYKLDLSDIVHIVNAAALHDIGKIAIDEKILNKPGKLTAEEFEIMKKHTVTGANMVRNLDPNLNDPLLKYAYEICLYHHEKYDGKGYPEGLKGDDIPIAAQVVSLCDVYDALREKRVYKPAYTCEKALEMIYNGECGNFNPLLIECLKDLENELKEESNIIFSKDKNK